MKTNLEIAQMIANEIDSSTEDEINTMLHITSKTHDIDFGWLFRVVGNLYGKMAKREPVKVSEMMPHEADPR